MPTYLCNKCRTAQGDVRYQSVRGCCAAFRTRATPRRWRDADAGTPEIVNVTGLVICFDCTNLMGRVVQASINIVPCADAHKYMWQSATCVPPSRVGGRDARPASGRPRAGRSAREGPRGKSGVFTDAL